MVGWIFTFSYDGLLAERLWESFGALSIIHARSIRVGFTAGPMDHIVGDDVIELQVNIFIGYFGAVDGISISD